MQAEDLTEGFDVGGAALGRWCVRPVAAGQERGARDLPEVHLVGTLGVRTKGVCGVLLFTSLVNQFFIEQVVQEPLPPT
jgi:hypothetical protein